jgi:hypothetical protein
VGDGKACEEERDSNEGDEKVEETGRERGEEKWKKEEK